MSEPTDNTPKNEWTEAPIDLVQERKKRKAKKGKKTKEPAEPEGMTLERAREIAKEVGLKVHDQDGIGIPFTDEAIEAAALLRAQDRAAYARLAAEIKGSDVNTNFWYASTKEKLQELKTQDRRSHDPRPVIEDRADLHEVIDEACEVLRGVGDVFERHGELVEIVEVERTEGPRPEIQQIRQPRLREILSRAARFERFTADGMKPIKPPKDVVESLHARGQWGLPPLLGFVEGACMLEDGDVLFTDGYHPGARLYVRNGVDVSAGLRNPTQDDARRAYELLTGLVEDFQFKEPKQVHKAAWVATILTIIARPAIKGSTPLFLYGANRPRIGKTRLADIACIIATGRDAFKQSYPSGRDADAELSKIITTTARSGNQIAFFDNVKGRIGGGSLELAITTSQWEGRILGESNKVQSELSLTWIATSNSASLTPDMHGRTLPVSQWTDLEHPEHRRDFKHPRIMEHVKSRREEYLSAALTILRAWHVAGRPEHQMKTWGSFESWSHIIRNSIVHAGGADPFNSREDLKDADTETSALAAVLRAWPDGAEYSASELGRFMDNAGKSDMFNPNSRQEAELGDALSEFLHSSSPNSIGMRLKTFMGRTVEGRQLVKGRSDNSRRWTVQSVTS